MVWLIDLVQSLFLINPSNVKYKSNLIRQFKVWTEIVILYVNPVVNVSHFILPTNVSHVWNYTWFNRAKIIHAVNPKKIQKLGLVFIISGFCALLESVSLKMLWYLRHFIILFHKFMFVLNRFNLEVVAWLKGRFLDPLWCPTFSLIGNWRSWHVLKGHWLLLTWVGSGVIIDDWRF